MRVPFSEINGEAWTEMSNLTAGMDMPVVLDLKLGTQTWTPGCSEEKRKYHEAKAKASTSLKLGVRVTGGTIRNGFGEELESIGYKKKKEVRSEAELRDCLGRYLCSDVMRREFLEKMRALHAWFSTQSDFHFFGTSVLLAFDGSVECPSELRVGLIDFPHVQEVNTPDESCKAGAATLLRVAADVVQASSK
uniref:Kinase n=1 Tax=Chrysotila carterae TaxID=13221 RepID=A0A6S9Z213_CHRCT